MKPYYTDSTGRIRIFHGDALEVMNALPLEPLAAVITDPPYSSGNLPETTKVRIPPHLRGWQWEGKVMETDQLSTLGFMWLVRALCLETRERVVDGGSLLAFIDWRNWGNLVGAVESSGLRVNNMVVWDKTSIGMGNGFRNQHELVLWATKGTPRVCSHAVPNVISCPRADNDLHQSPKPVRLMADLLRVVSEPGDLVMDPFMGSASTLVAAKQLGRCAIGIELEERYVEAAIKRLEQEVLPLWDEPQPAPATQSLFSALEAPGRGGTGEGEGVEG